MSSAENPNIHRYLDDAFADVSMNAELRDLKEEIRSNLAERVAELTGQGATPADAAARAIDEFGDLGEVISSVQSGQGAEPLSKAATQAQAFAVNKVTPRPGFVIGTVILALVAVASLLWFILILAGSNPGAGDAGTGPAAAVLAGFAATLSIGAITAWSLRQETSQDHPVPLRRALGYGAGAAAAVAGLFLMSLVVLAGMGLLFAGAFVLLGAVVIFIKLGLSQSNRKKAWAREVQRDYQGMDRFSQDPVAAARFGIYTAVIWLVALALFVWLSFTAGFAYSWLALLAGLVVFMLVLARMLFPSGEGSLHKSKEK
ncbi:hypothetical protein AL755_11205 [Arthrobacter sp. ERGS1:01]|uniref:permease prefix domain 1-containing protein n=1 Tax=Arthrobacter sp. ERGS1:01 TaxID=1704044 RepID=UPI0006B5DB54|nr:permease prefix domain 1-containing protein [Arthrobacter sp. ERGS1:01]ALE05901.1 hypothetical protein AL755_11205 [Arthrobacter sp. ERGS1:01]